MWVDVGFIKGGGCGGGGREEEERYFWEPPPGCKVGFTFFDCQLVSGES